MKHHRYMRGANWKSVKAVEIFGCYKNGRVLRSGHHIIYTRNGKVWRQGGHTQAEGTKPPRSQAGPKAGSLGPLDFWFLAEAKHQLISTWDWALPSCHWLIDIWPNNNCFLASLLWNIAHSNTNMTEDSLFRMKKETNERVLLSR